MVINASSRCLIDHIKSFQRIFDIYLLVKPPMGQLATKTSRNMSLWFADHELFIDWKIIILQPPYPWGTSMVIRTIQGFYTQVLTLAGSMEARLTILLSHAQDLFWYHMSLYQQEIKSLFVRGNWVWNQAKRDLSSRGTAGCVCFFHTRWVEATTAGPTKKGNRSMVESLIIYAGLK